MSTKNEDPDLWDDLKLPKLCPSCETEGAEIMMLSYVRGREIILCRGCALQLSRKLLEDLCALDGDRHG